VISYSLAKKIEETGHWRRSSAGADGVLKKKQLGEMIQQQTDVVATQTYFYVHPGSLGVS